MSRSVSNPLAPMWQRIVMAVLSLGAILAVVSQASTEPGIGAFTVLEWIRFTGALGGLYLFASVAITGLLPAWFLRFKRDS